MQKHIIVLLPSPLEQTNKIKLMRCSSQQPRGWGKSTGVRTASHTRAQNRAVHISITTLCIALLPPTAAHPPACHSAAGGGFVASMRTELPLPFSESVNIPGAGGAIDLGV